MPSAADFANAMNPPYLFIDGGYLRGMFNDAVNRVLGTEFHPELERVKYYACNTAQKVFFYDCLNDKKSPDETDDQFDKRLQEQIRYHEEIKSHDGFHLREGSLVGEVVGKKKKKRQKKIDVWLATDALTHAFSRNTKSVFILAGDLDFQPVVESLVHSGAYVTILGAWKSTSRELRMSADAYREFTVRELWACVPEEIRKTTPFPTRVRIQNSGYTQQGDKPDGTVSVCFRGEQVEMPVGRRTNGNYFTHFDWRNDTIDVFEFKDRDVLKRFVEVCGAEKPPV